MAEACSAATPTQRGWGHSGGAIKHGDLCLDASNKAELALAACTGSPAQQFAVGEAGGPIKSADGSCLDVWNWAGPRVDLFECNGGTNQRFTFGSGGTLETAAGQGHDARCLGTAATPPGGSGNSGAPVQVWGKPLLNGSFAVLVLNRQRNASTSVPVDFARLNLSATAAHSVYDVWAQKADGTGMQRSVTLAVPPLDSAFVIIAPQ